MSALISFLGGSAFRLIWGELSAFLSKRQDHRHELAMIDVQAKVSAQTHAQNLEAIRVQADLGVKTIQVQADADLSRIDAGAWAEAVSAVGRQTGIAFIDIWNGSIRPALATIAIVMVVLQIARHGFDLTDWDRELFGAILGIYVADRTLAKRGK